MRVLAAQAHLRGAKQPIHDVHVAFHAVVHHLRPILPEHNEDWRFPMSDAYNKLIDSPIADMKNVGPRGAGSITAAQFIGRFVENGVKWAHLDIAGMVWADKAGNTYDKGATGYGVRLLDRFVADNYEG